MLLARPLWVMVRYFEIRCYLPCYRALHGEAEEAALNSEPRGPGSHVGSVSDLLV